MTDKSKNTKLKIISITIKAILVVIAIYSIKNVMFWRFDRDKSLEILKSIDTVSKIEEIEDNENTELIDELEPDESSNKQNPYYDYVKMNLIDVNFTKLKKMNSDTKGWIQVGGTNINYPYVQASNNDYYLTRAFDKKYNSAGWVFMDYRNNADNFDKNTILYAHGRLDRTMFGSLKNILKSGWLNDSKNYVIKLSTETENTLWQVFSVYHIPTTIDYLQINFSSDEEFLDFASMLQNRSAHNFNTTVGKDTKILTLSTCYNNTDKVVLHAKLIKKETK